MNEEIIKINTDISDLKMPIFPVGFLFCSFYNLGTQFTVHGSTFQLVTAHGGLTNILLYGGATNAVELIGNNQITLQLANMPPHAHDYYTWSSKNDPAGSDLAFEKGNGLSTKYWMTTDTSGGYTNGQGQLVPMPITLPIPQGLRTFLYQCTSNTY